MKKIISAASLLLLCACAQTGIIGYNREQRTVQIVGNRFADSNDLYRQAYAACGGPAQQIGMEQRAVGSVSTSQSYGSAQGNGWGSASYSGNNAGQTQLVHQNVFTYHCQ